MTIKAPASALFSRLEIDRRCRPVGESARVDGERRAAGLAALEERYARGEITREEFLERTRDLAR